jgi:hypothetical protein
MITIFIGICAVLAVVMIVIGGLEYMTSELPGNKEHGKERITGAVFGLILALGAYALLYTINPNLLNSDLALPDATVQVIQNFQVAGAQSASFTSPPINIDFKAQAYPAANAASKSTGVDPALILAVFAQESGSGANTGKCHWTDAAAKMSPADKTALQTITTGLGKDINDTPVSCAGTVGSGGAIGLTQFRPSTWLENSTEVAGRLGHQPNPWLVDDALMATAVFLKNHGGATDPRAAACAYFGQCSSGGVNYADQILGKMASLQKQIADEKKKGTIQ